MTFSFTTTSGLVCPPKVMVCAAAGSADAVNRAPVTIAARQAASRREADAEILPMRQTPICPDGRPTPTQRDLPAPKYLAAGHASTTSFYLKIQGVPVAFMASLRSAVSGRRR